MSSDSEPQKPWATTSHSSDELRQVRADLNTIAGLHEAFAQAALDAITELRELLRAETQARIALEQTLNDRISVIPRAGMTN